MIDISARALEEIDSINIDVDITRSRWPDSCYLCYRGDIRPSAITNSQESGGKVIITDQQWKMLSHGDNIYSLYFAPEIEIAQVKDL